MGFEGRTGEPKVSRPPLKLPSQPPLRESFVGCVLRTTMPRLAAGTEARPTGILNLVPKLRLGTLMTVNVPHLAGNHPKPSKRAGEQMSARAERKLRRPAGLSRSWTSGIFPMMGTPVIASITSGLVCSASPGLAG
jgi:hypothetical protein